MLPLTIQTIVTILGSGIHGAIAYVGGHSCSYQHPPERRDEECRPSKPSFFEDGAFHGEVYLRFRCNGKPGAVWTFFIAYEPDDTFSVWLVAAKSGNVLASHREVYIDNLKEVVECSYDDAIREYNDGYIPC